MKKLMVFSLTLFFLLGSTALNSAGNPVKVDKAKKPAFVTNQGSNSIVKKRVRNPHMKALDSKQSALKEKVVTIPVENAAKPAQDVEGDVIPVREKKASKPDMIRKHGYLYPGNPEIVPLGSDRGVHGYLFNYDDEDAEYYLSGGISGDEWGIWFQSPQAACSLYAVEWQFYGGVPGGTINFNVMEAGSVWPDTVANADSIAIEDVFGDNLMGTGMEFPLEMEATSDWERLEFPIWGFDINVGRDIFWIHWTKTGDYPMLLGDSDNPGGYLHTWDYEPNQDGDWKWSHYGSSVGIEAMVRCEVIFYEDPPPNVAAVQTNDTYSTDAITVTASASDNALDPALEGIASGNLVYRVNGGDWVTVAATVTGDTAAGFTLTETIPTGDTGDEVEYFFEAWDLADLYARSFPSLFFERTEPANPDADLLIIADGENSDQAAFDLYRTVLDENSFVYEYWNAGDRNGIDASVVGFGWSNIIVYGWGTSTVPAIAAEEDPGYGDFLDAGGNLLLVDQDWFYGHGLPDNPTFTAGDFAYDYFGFTGGTNDPCTGSPCVSTADTVFYGQDVTPMDSPFTEALGGIALQHYGIYGTTNWGDYFDLSGDATAIFLGATDGNIYGAVKETGTYKAVNLGFMVDAAVDTTAEGDITYDAFADFLVGVIEYFDVTSPAKITDVDGPSVTSVFSGPWDVSATIIDANGDDITATLWWSDDGGTTENDVAMTAVADTFSAEIPQLTFTETTPVYYYIEAVSAGQSAETDDFEFWVFIPSADVLYFWDDIYSNFDYQDGIHLDYDEYDPWVYGLPDSTLITNTNYSTIIWNADLVDLLDHVYFLDMEDQLAAFVDGGGNLALSSDELMGKVTGWTDTSFAAGDFFYDYIGIDSVFNDVGVDSLIAVAGDPVTDGLTFGTYVAWYYAWADKVTTTNGGVVMITDKDGDYGFGVRREGTGGQGKTTFLAFVSTYMDVSEYGPLLDGILTWFGHTVSVDEQVTVLPEAFRLHQNYPNPFNPVTNLQFDLPEGADVKLVIYNLLGQKVTTLANRKLEAGYHNILWNGTDAFGSPVGSGIYIYRLTAGDFTSSKKMLLLK